MGEIINKVWCDDHDWGCPGHANSPVINKALYLAELDMTMAGFLTKPTGIAS
jgi:hypothetical protein